MELADTRDHYSVKEAAALLGTSVWTVYRRIKEGDLEVFRAAGGRTQRVTAASVHAFMHRHGIPRPSSGKIPVLIVDDDADVCSLLETHMKRDGRFDVRVAMSGFKAGAELEAFRPQLILLDIQLGDMDGRELIAHISDAPEHSGVKVIAVSGYLDHSHWPELEALGFDAFAPKPLRLEALSAVINDVLARATPLRRTRGPEAAGV